MYLILKNIVSKRSFEFYKDVGIIYVFISFFYNAIYRNYKGQAIDNHIFEITFIIVPLIVIVLFIIFLHGFILTDRSPEIP
ncbi:MAG: hypothetical protein A2W19_05670 [Spirochaetes bacterium RBG_16_49_21]|nr:MAG: hypothetical protein A2W19_05670 [Spirochaetes bacterium RBG_16_49_21]